MNPDAEIRDASRNGTSSYPGGKSGAGIYQRLINLIPRHKILITAFAGQCGVTRNIKPADHTIVIDADERVCEWWDSWRRTPAGRDLEIHHCDSIEWLRFRFGLTEYSASQPCDTRAGSVAEKCGTDVCAAEECVDRGSRTIPRPVMKAFAADSCGSAVPPQNATAATADESGDGRPQTFIFCDPPYVLSKRAHGKQYAYEMSDDDHARLVSTLTTISAAGSGNVMLCGYQSAIYAAVDRLWRTIDHRVPTRGGLQDERIWMNYAKPDRLHDYRYIGSCRRSRERIRRRQRNWQSQLEAMSTEERLAMLEALSEAEP